MPMKSPLKDRPLRNPGDSVQKLLDDYLLDKVVFYILLAACFITVAVIDWLRYLSESPINPWLFTVASFLLTLTAAYKIIRAIPVIHQLKLGRDGERAVGQHLETLRESGAKVFHDIPANKFNLDHVVVASAGIFLIETKTYSKPDKGEPTVTFDGESVSLRTRGKFAEPVTQVTAGARWLKDLLNQSTGREFPIRPVLLFPGWFVQPTVEAKRSDVWVLNPKALPSFIANSTPVLTPEDVSLAAYHLSRYIRTFKPT